LISLAALTPETICFFLILASLIAIILMSGILSSITLSGVACACNYPNTFSPPAGSRSLELQKRKTNSAFFLSAAWKR